MAKKTQKISSYCLASERRPKKGLTSRLAAGTRGVRGLPRGIHATYFAMFDPAEEGGYNVFFPDFPGCVTFGKNFEEAKEKAREVLELWIEELISQRQKLPKAATRPIIDEVRVALP